MRRLPALLATLVWIPWIVCTLPISACTDRRSPEQMHDTLIIGIDEDVKTFDPVYQKMMLEGAVMALVQEPLTFYDQEQKLIPRLALSWETPDDCKTWIFHLRHNVKFHDGTPFNAEAVKFHFDRHLDPETASQKTERLKDIDWVEVRDEYTVVFHFKQPNCLFPESIRDPYGQIVSPAAVRKWGNDGYGRHPVGTGPYIVEEIIPDVSIKMRKNHDYWNADAYPIERIEFRPVRENTTRLILLEQGVLDMAEIYWAHVDTARHIPDIDVQSIPTLSIRYIGFNVKKPPFDNVLVRRAANYAVDKEAIAKYVLFDTVEAAKSPLPPVLPVHNSDVNPYKYDPEKAKELLREAGYPDGFDCDLWTMESGTYRAVAEAVVEYLRQVNIRARMITYDSAVYWDKFDEFLTPEGEEFPTKEGCYDVYIGGWTGGESPYSTLYPLFIGKSYHNSSFYDSPEVNELLNSLKTMTDPAERDVIYRKLQEIIVDDAPWIFAYHGQITFGMRPRVQGFHVSPAEEFNMAGVRVLDPDEEETQ
jgi:peptide/nickel transport system substrate-binding protein